MPELPEVESIRLTLAPRLIGTRITRATLLRRDILIAPGDPAGGFSRQRPARTASHSRQALITAPFSPIDLLEGCTVTSLERRGKQLAIFAHAPAPRSTTDHILVVQLGMSGQLFLHDPESPALTHVHACWELGPSPKSTSRAQSRASSRDSQLLFRDPRRFGGIRIFRSRADLDSHWADLGPDALTLTTEQLRDAIADSDRPIKAILLDQSLIAGIGNIYADEALFRAKVAPNRRGTKTARIRARQLAAAIRKVLSEAISARGSTLRDYRDGRGNEGSFQARHAVYGRAGKPCLKCSTTLRSALLGQRTTVWCPSCQV